MYFGKVYEVASCFLSTIVDISIVPYAVVGVYSESGLFGKITKCFLTHQRHQWRKKLVAVLDEDGKVTSSHCLHVMLELLNVP